MNEETEETTVEKAQPNIAFIGKPEIDALDQGKVYAENEPLRRINRAGGKAIILPLPEFQKEKGAGGWYDKNAAAIIRFAPHLYKRATPKGEK